MKNIWNHTGFTLGIVLLAAACLGGSHTQLSEQESVKSEIASPTMAPNVPSAATFAGEELDLTRYDLRERMDRELMSFTYTHSTTMLMIKRANRYFPVIEPILKANGIPDDFKYLMVIESNLNTLACSSAGAAGLWQFMPETGKQFGLEVNNNIDERYHVEKATVAACKYLKQAYGRYNNWLSVAASYNAGQGRISGELTKQLADRAVDLWLVEETSRYIFRILAARMVIGEPQRYGFLLKREQLYPPLHYREVTVTKGIASLADFAKQNGITYRELKDANPWLRQTNLENKSGRTYKLLIPSHESMYYDPRQIRPHEKNWVIN